MKQPFLLLVATAAGTPIPVAVNISQYAGRWYQMYGSATVQWTFEVGGNCVTADYAHWPPRADVITVTNTVQPGGRPVRVSGYAVASPLPVPCAPPCEQPGTLDVVLGPPGQGADPSQAGEFNSTNYLIFGLGPIVEGLYDYALVSDPRGESLYVLARDVARWEVYDEAVLTLLSEMNFTGFLNRPRKTRQDNCTYTPLPPPPSSVQ